MSTSNTDYVGSHVLVYNDEGENIFDTIVIEYDKVDKHIILEELPPELSVGDTCKLFVLTEPTPKECFGRIKFDAGKTIVAIFKEQSKEQRRATRYKVDFTGSIEKLVYDKQPYALHEPVEVKLINISTGGVRFKAHPDTISKGDSFHMRVAIRSEVKLLIATVVNNKEINSENAEYGCRFIAASEMR